MKSLPDLVHKINTLENRINMLEAEVENRLRNLEETVEEMKRQRRWLVEEAAVLFRD